MLKLVESIKEDGFMLAVRWLVVDSNNVVVGGNQRLKACELAGLEQVYVVYTKDLSEVQLKDFIVKDNLYFGEWNEPLLSAFHPTQELIEIKNKVQEIEPPQIDSTPSPSNSQTKSEPLLENAKDKQLITFFPQDIYEKVIESLAYIKIDMNCEKNVEVLLNLLMHWKRNYGKN